VNLSLVPPDTISNASAEATVLVPLQKRIEAMNRRASSRMFALQSTTWSGDRARAGGAVLQSPAPVGGQGTSEDEEGEGGARRGEGGGGDGAGGRTGRRAGGNAGRSSGGDAATHS
jgi:hypothetical protein